MKVGFVQFAVKFGDKQANFRKVNELLRGKQADIWVLPELFNTGYVFLSKEEAKGLAENIPGGETTEFLKKLSRLNDCIVVAGLAEKDGPHLFNSAVVVSKGEFIGVYRKIHLFNEEKLFFKSGDKEFPVFEIDSIKLGVMICFDWIFPEAMRTLALQGAEIVCHPSNLVMPYCQNAMTTRCLENHVFAVTANRIGVESRGEKSLEFTGGSQITGVKGEILYRSETNTEEAVFVEIDLRQAKDKKLNPLNDLFLDRKPDFYLL